MPFTISHAVVAVPFAGRRLPGGSAVPVSALAIGAMTPDLPLFFPGTVSYLTTHSPTGIVAVVVPIGIVLFAVWRLLLRPALSGLIPHALGDRVPRHWDVPLASSPELTARAGSAVLRGGLVLVLLTLGAASHVFWDLFTHGGRQGEVWFPVLGQTWGPLLATKWLQYGSTVFGAGVIGWHIAREVRHRSPEPRVDAVAVRLLRTGLPVAVLAAFVAAAGLHIAARGVPATAEDGYPLAYATATGGGAVVIVLVLIAAVIVRLTRLRAAVGGSSPEGLPSAP